MGGLLHLVQRGGAWVGCGPAQSPPRCTKCNSPPIDDQCTNFVALQLRVISKGLTERSVKPYCAVTPLSLLVLDIITYNTYNLLVV